VALKGARPVYFDGAGWLDTAVYDRDRLMPGMRFAGPAIVEERESTCVLQPGNRVRVDAYQSLIVDIA
jgi:N-methylhydantoinase A